jgi:hypothetical protein
VITASGFIHVCRRLLSAADNDNDVPDDER